MATDGGDQVQDCCRILVSAGDDGAGTPNVQCGSPLESQMCTDASVNCHKSVVEERESSDLFSSPCSIHVDIETGSADVSRINQECGSFKTDIALTKPLRRQNSSQAGESIAPLMDQILMLLKFDPKEKQAIERAHEAANNRWRKYKRAASFDSRRVVLLFSFLSSMGTIFLIYLTLRVREVSDGYI